VDDGRLSSGKRKSFLAKGDPEEMLTTVESIATSVMTGHCFVGACQQRSVGLNRSRGTLRRSVGGMPKVGSWLCFELRFAKFLGKSPDTATDEDLRRFQLHLIDQGTSPITLNATIVGLNFLFEVTLGRPETMAKMQSVRVLQKLPVILSKDEVTCLLHSSRWKRGIDRRL